MPAFTIISNANAILKSFAKPVLVDSDPVTWNIKVDDIEKKFQKKQKQLCCLIFMVFQIIWIKFWRFKKYSLYLIEDAAEMIGQNSEVNPVEALEI